jgi:hypothetical protein
VGIEITNTAIAIPGENRSQKKRLRQKIRKEITHQPAN